MKNSLDIRVDDLPHVVSAGGATAVAVIGLVIQIKCRRPTRTCIARRPPPSGVT